MSDGVSGCPTGRPGAKRAARRLKSGGSRISEPKPGHVGRLAATLLGISVMWEKSGKADSQSDLLNSLSERRQQFLDSLFYNVDLISKFNNPLPLKANVSMEISLGARLVLRSFPYF